VAHLLLREANGDEGVGLEIDLDLAVRGEEGGVSMRPFTRSAQRGDALRVDGEEEEEEDDQIYFGWEGEEGQ
jgi:hypothetical protein